MKWYQVLPHLNATLNTIAFVLLVLGWRAIRRGDRERHARRMGLAFAVSVLFLVSYLVYHGVAGHVVYAGEGTQRVIYLVILGSHIVLAALVPVLALITLVLALRGRLPGHRRLARWTLPLWLYVSVTGVVVYAMLYVFPPA